MFNVEDIKTRKNPRFSACRFHLTRVILREGTKRSSCIFEMVWRTSRARAKISHITEISADSLLREAKRLVKFIRV